MQMAYKLDELSRPAGETIDATNIATDMNITENNSSPNYSTNARSNIHTDKFINHKNNQYTLSSSYNTNILNKNKSIYK